VDEIEEWFEREFGHLGFTLTPIMYDPTMFTPMKGVMFENGDGLRLTRMRIVPELANDVTGGFAPLPDPEQERRDLITREIYRFLDKQEPKNFTPKKNITKHKL
jgi:hypothetical protein